VNWMLVPCTGLAAGQLGHGVCSTATVCRETRRSREVVSNGLWTNDASAMNNLALQLATSKNARIRNPQEASSLATRRSLPRTIRTTFDTFGCGVFRGRTDGQCH